ncbi:metal/formaldehyde-sensitive transcriptional repressor [Saccharophagus degradans]|uniref:metal/formaldehyde-sensitive transcriptional repressor n=1 Tax=Saccharophagus degradans TaxID=86304 RepID=UPI001C08680B|nr:metal/formaldehyde-sensitive transcriptional repressor [Saccharophagus degradans]MBU2985636.1 metal/formaldehyde-sensitive transcriptional repressor [Saccharophagus degradans]
MSHTIKNKKSLITRIRRIKGQASALEKLLETEPECNKVLQQISAIRGATNGLMLEVLDDHLREHLLTSDVEQKHDDLNEVIKILRTYLK